MNIYESCPTFVTQRYVIRLVRREDAPGLLSVYKDKNAQPYFNADNCTSNFRYTTYREMRECVDMWVWSYENGWFVRWVILEKNAPIGTVEMFRRDDGDDGRGCGVLRMDVKGSSEFDDVFDELLDAMLQPMHEHFGCAEILTKAPSFAMQRRSSLKKNGFLPAKPMRLKNGLVCCDYWSHRA